MRGENLQLTEKLEEMLRVNQKLRESNSLLQGKCETLLEDLSVKEARWTEKEEALTAEVRGCQSNVWRFCLECLLNLLIHVY